MVSIPIKSEDNTKPDINVHSL